MSSRVSTAVVALARQGRSEDSGLTRLKQMYGYQAISQTYHEPHPYKLGLPSLGTQQMADLAIRDRNIWKLVLKEC